MGLNVRSRRVIPLNIRLVDQSESQSVELSRASLRLYHIYIIFQPQDPSKEDGVHTRTLIYKTKQRLE